MPSDDGSQLESLWNAIGSSIFTTIDNYGWIVPALLLSILFLGVIALVAWCLEDFPFDADIPLEVREIFRRTRKWWHGNPSANELSN